MGKTSTKVLIALAALFVVLAVLQIRRQGDSGPEAVQARGLFPHLDLAAVAAVQFEQADGSVTLRRGDDGVWGVDQRAGYPVDGEKLRRLALGVVQLQARDRLTENPEKYATLGLAEPPQAGAITLRDAAGNALAHLRLGQTKQSKGAGGLTGQFVRVDDDPTVYLVTSAPTVDISTTAWLDRTLLELAADQVVEVAVDRPEGGFVAARQQPSDPLTLTSPLPSGRRVDSGALGDLGRALVNLRCDDALAAADPAAANLAFDIAFAARTVDNLRYRVALAARDGVYYARLGAEALPATATAETASSGESSPAVASKAGDPAVADAFTKRHQGWLYTIPKSTYDRLAKTREDLLVKE